MLGERCQLCPLSVLWEACSMIDQLHHDDLHNLCLEFDLLVGAGPSRRRSISSKFFCERKKKKKDHYKLK